jgi:uncharacterized protein YbjT (DUF2867 family)
MSKPVIAVVGGTGAQGGGVVDALLQRGRFAVRVLTRSPESDKAKALVARGVEVVAADLNDPSTLVPAFRGSHGAFLVTNFWDPSTGPIETEVGAAMVAAAKEAGVSHAIWSTLPNPKHHSNGELSVHHFTGKALVDASVKAAGFPTHTFVEAPFYFQNLAGMLRAQPLGDGRTGWAVPMDPAAEVIHAGDVRDVGRVAARAFEVPEQVNGQHLSVAPARVSWNQLAETLNAQGHALSVVQVPAEVYDGFFPGAPEMREMFQWFERFTYFGPDAERKLAQAHAVHPEPLTPFADWAAMHMPAAAAVK